MTKWLIHRFECPDCGEDVRADRPVGCWNCGTEVEHADTIGELEL